MTEIVSRAAVEECLEWIEDWRAGDFTPAYYRQSGELWPVEMLGLVESYEKLAAAYLQAMTAIEGAERALRLLWAQHQFTTIVSQVRERYPELFGLSPDTTEPDGDPECDTYRACGRGCCG